MDITERESLNSIPACQICKSEFDTRNPRQIDHDHYTNLVRGVICSNCNLGLGLLGDNLENLMRAVAYLQSPPAQLNGEKIRYHEPEALVRELQKLNRLVSALDGSAPSYRRRRKVTRG